MDNLEDIVAVKVCKSLYIRYGDFNFMNLRKLASKIEGWNTVDDVVNKLRLKRTSAYVYLSLLNKHGFVIQKIKKPRGTAYSIGKTPVKYKKLGIYEDTDFIAPELEFTEKKVLPEHKISFFLWKLKTGGTYRNYNEAMKIVKNIKKWKILYKYLKAYGVKKEFNQLYNDARKSIPKIPTIPKRYKKLLGVGDAS